MEEVFLTKSAEETQKFAEEFAKKLIDKGSTLSGTHRVEPCKDGAQILLLYGDLGAGKTTFVQGFARGLGIEKRIISPTFIILRTYAILLHKDKADTIKRFYHTDLYRLEKEMEVEGLGLVELMQDPENIVVIEWPERLGSLMPKRRLEIRFETLSDTERKIYISKFTIPKV